MISILEKDKKKFSFPLYYNFYNILIRELNFLSQRNF